MYIVLFKCRKSMYLWYMFGSRLKCTSIEFVCVYYFIWMGSVWNIFEFEKKKRIWTWNAIIFYVYSVECVAYLLSTPCYNEQLLMEQYLPAACRVNTEELETIFEKIKRKRENESHQSIRYIFIHTQTFKTQAHTHSHRILTHQTKHYRHLRIHTSAQLHL